MFSESRTENPESNNCFAPFFSRESRIDDREPRIENPEIENPSSIKDGTVIRVIKSVSDEVAEAVQNAINSGMGVKSGKTVTFPANARSQLKM